MTEPAFIAARIVTAIHAAKVNISTEEAAQRDIASALARAGFEAQREVRLTSTERIDFMVGAVGIEVKVKHSKRDILRQLERYAALSEIRALVLATGRSWPGAIRQVGSVPLAVADLSRGWL